MLYCLLKSLLYGFFTITKRLYQHIKSMTELLPVQPEKFIEGIGIGFGFNHFIVFLQVVEYVGDFLTVISQYAAERLFR